MLDTDYLKARELDRDAAELFRIADKREAKGSRITHHKLRLDAVKFAARAATLRAAYAEEVSGVDLDAMARGYARAHLGNTYHEADENGDASDRPLDHNFDVVDLPAAYWTHAHERVASFVQAHPLACRMYVTARGGHGEPGRVAGSEDLGYYLYMDQQGTGVGMWDRGLGGLGYYLSRMTDERDEDHSSLCVDWRGKLAHDNPAAAREYTVRWEMVVRAQTPEHAAEVARDELGGGQAGSEFSVREEASAGAWQWVDLADRIDAEAAAAKRAPAAPVALAIHHPGALAPGDSDEREALAAYLEHVAAEIRAGMRSGHTEPGIYWEAL